MRRSKNNPEDHRILAGRKANGMWKWWRKILKTLKIHICTVSAEIFNSIFISLVRSESLIILSFTSESLGGKYCGEKHIARYFHTEPDAHFLCLCLLFLTTGVVLVRNNGFCQRSVKQAGKGLVYSAQWCEFCKAAQKTPWPSKKNWGVSASNCSCFCLTGEGQVHPGDG